MYLPKFLGCQLFALTGRLSFKVLCILCGATKATLLIIKTRPSRENRRKSNKSLIHRRLKAA